MATVGELCGFVKQAESAGYGYDGLALQQYVPIRPRRDLSAEEQEAVKRDSKKWLRGPFASEGDSMTRKLADPKKRALLLSLIGGTAGAAYGGLIGGAAKGEQALSGTGAAIGGASVAALVGILSYLGNKKENKNIIDRMRRLPEGSTSIRDMESDPTWQSKQDRVTQLRAAAMIANSNRR